MARPINYSTAARRWAGLGPYYAMFPTEFADRVVRTHTQIGDLIIDPFAGRGTAIFSGATQGRLAIGIEINPVGFVFAKTKIGAADYESVEKRLHYLGRSADDYRYEQGARSLPLFFRRCFTAPVRRFLLAARERLDWRRSSTDRTTMAILLVYLHGREGAALSNQMRQTKSMSPDYAIRWWAERDKSPPNIDPVDFLTSRLKWRYAKGTPECETSTVYLGNSLTVLPRLAGQVERGELRKANLLFTSPPYYRVTNYHYDQWLRLWLLGGPPHALRTGNGRRGKFENRDDYKILLEEVFRRAKKLLHRDATVYVRTDARSFTRDTTIGVLRAVFSHKALSVRPRPVLGATQTDLFGDFDDKAGEVDLVMTPR
jgi:hypothetical protein